MTQQDVNVAVTAEDVQEVMKVNPLMSLQVQNRALMRKLSEMSIALDAAMIENKRITVAFDELNGKNGFKAAVDNALSRKENSKNLKEK